VFLTYHQINLLFCLTSPLMASKEKLRNQIGAFCGERVVMMVVSEATQARTRKDKAPAVNISALSEVQDASQSLQANPWSASPRPLERETYVTVDTLKNFMSVMTETITRQVSQQVKWALEAANSARRLPYFDYLPTAGCESSHRQVRIPSPHFAEREQEASRSNRGR